MPTSLHAVRKYSETWEQFWGREIKWAIAKLEEEGKNINITSIGKLTSIKKHNVIKVMKQM